MKTIPFILFIVLFTVSTLGYTVTKNNKTEKKPDDFNVIITGIKDKKITESIEKNLSLLRYKPYALEDINHLRLFYNSIDDETKNILIKYGYFSPKVNVSTDEQQSTWIIQIDIQLNEQTTVTSIKLTTTPNIKAIDQDFIEQLPLKKGSPLLQEDYLGTKTKLITIANEKGYLDAVLDENRILLNKDTNDAQIEFHITLGKRYRYGKITITQKKYLFNDDFIEKFIPLKEGQTYDATQMNKAQKQLDQSAYFASVSVVPDLKNRDAHKGIVPVDIELIARDSQSYSIGGGYGTFTGPRMTLGAAYPHLSANGHSAQLQLQLSKINTSFLAQYLIPGSDPVHTFWSLNAQQSLYDLIPYKALETIIGVNYIDNITNSISVNLGLHEYLVRYTTADDDSTRNARYFVPSFNLSYSLRYPDGFFENGLFFSDLVQASKYINSISDESFVRNLATLRIALPMLPQWTRFISSFNFGALSVDDVTTIAPEFRFYAGGIGTLLGYAYLSQGPTIDGNLSGGRYLFTSSYGIEQRIYGNFSTIIYYNFGNAFNQFNDMNILYAAGVGLSWKSPLGAIVGYLTRTLNEGDEHWRFDFSIGTYF